MCYFFFVFVFFDFFLFFWCMLFFFFFICVFYFFFFFFFQAEDGIRDRNVTGVQTCALPISDWGARIISSLDPRYDPGGYHYGSVWPLFTGWAAVGEYRYHRALAAYSNLRSEERRVGKGVRFGCSGEGCRKKKLGCV